MDDDWESGDDNEMHLKDWKRVERNLEKTGYKEGMESSQEEKLQEGFNQSFRQALTMAFGAGRLQGGICASIGSNLTTEQDSNKSSDTLGNLNNNISSLLSEIPDILGASESGCGQACSCTLELSGDADANENLVQNYWNRINDIQISAEREDKHLDSALPPTE